MSKLNQTLTLIANIAVVIGIIILAAELRQNTQAVRAQTRDAVTEKQMMYYGWIATSPEVADVFARGNDGRADLMGGEALMYSFLVQGIFREFENSHYQFQQGLFTAEEFEPRMNRWRVGMNNPGWRELWSLVRMGYAPAFRTEMDSIIRAVETQGSN